ncbi:MAG: peptidase M3 [Candidatus Marinimicrobia bacterium]|nr:peptidase M3 [Candidatus Neomarinimicrobiota bacterium]
MSINKNPFFKKNQNFDNAAIFDKVKPEHFVPAIEEAIKIARIYIDGIADSADNATFENTVLALEDSTEYLDTITSVYYHLFSSEAGSEIEGLASKISPMLANFSNDIYLNLPLFKKIDEVIKDKDSLSKQDGRLTEVYHKRFVRNGAMLKKEEKQKLRDIDSELSSLSPKFSSNVRQATNDFEYWVDSKKDLKGLPDMAIDAARESAKEKGEPSKWLFTLQFPSMAPVMKFAENRKMREQISNAFTKKCLNGKFDNSKLIKQIVGLRHKRANLLGYKNYADYVLEERMAENSSNVYDLLDKLYDKAYPAAANETAELKTFAKAEDKVKTFMSWDRAYYSEKLKKMLYDFDEELLRPYFKSENVIKGVFEIATKLYGITFNEADSMPVWHDDVKTYKAIDKNGEYIGLLYVDLYPRETKKGGAWMNELQSHGKIRGEMKKPHICLTCNLTKSTEKKPALLSFSEVTTIFHEFGHCLHGLLSDIDYKTIGGTSVFWDFVELPSQIMENWVLEEDALKIFAKHYETNEVMPLDMIKKLKASRNFMTGSMCLRQLRFSYLDMGYHDNIVDLPDIETFEDVVIGKTRLLPKEKGSSISCGFAHIFAGGYAAGYYSYKWAEVLEADAFSKFKKEGIFNKDTASLFRNNILSKGNIKHPMELFKSFMGREPKVEALLERDGLLKTNKA